MKRSPMKPRTTPLRKRNPKRHGKNWTRAYGSVERVQWLQQQPCCVMGCGRRPSENAHAVGGGISRKADAATILPLCATHHRELHAVGVRTFEALHGLSLKACSDRTAAQWDAHQERVA